MKSAVAIALFLTSVSLQAQMIDFVEPDWQLTMDKAKKENKMLMVYVNTIWCEPCLEMEQTVFQDQDIHQFYSDKFVNVPFDAEAFPGVEVANKYDIFIYPSFLFIDAQGELIHKGCGLMNAQEFLQLGKEAITEAETLQHFQNAFENGERSPDFLFEFISMVEESCGDTRAVVNQYFDQLPKDQWSNESSWTIINLAVSDPFSPYFQYLLANKATFESTYGKDVVDAKIYDVLLGVVMDLYEGADLTLFSNQALQMIMKDLSFDGKPELSHLVSLQYAELVKDWEFYASNAINVVEEQNVTDPDQLEEFAWNFYLHVMDKDALTTALGWMKDVLRQEKTASRMDTYASLLFKLGHQAEAVKWEKKALNMAKNDLEDTMHYQLQLLKFEGAK